MVFEDWWTDTNTVLCSFGPLKSKTQDPFTSVVLSFGFIHGRSCVQGSQISLKDDRAFSLLHQELPQILVLCSP